MKKKTGITLAVVCALVVLLWGANSGDKGGLEPADLGKTPSISASASPRANPTRTSPAPVSDSTRSEPTPVQPEPTAAAPPASPNTALSLLQSLPVKGRAPKTGYQRKNFGPRWQDVDRNGCDTRNDILNRDLTEVTHRPQTAGCVVLSGKLNDPYSGMVLEFTKSRASEIQIDHIVALANAWQTGAQALTSEWRAALANDPLNLLAVQGRLNQQKSAGDAATWLPPNKGFRCEYISRQVQVKAKYGLWVTPPEHDAMARILAGCP